VKIKSFRDLEIWKRSIKLVPDICRETKSFPKEEIYTLVSQIRRSAVSIPSNIAEGFSRFYNKEYRQFLYISLGSCSELTTQLMIASRLGYITVNREQTLVNEIEVISKTITSLIKKLNTND